MAEPVIEGRLACAVADLPDAFALDFLRGYHALMCDCGADHPRAWWTGTLDGMRRDIRAAEQLPDAVPASVWRAITVPVGAVKNWHHTGECGGLCACCEFHPEAVCGEDCGGCCNEAEEAS